MARRNKVRHNIIPTNYDEKNNGIMSMTMTKISASIQIANWIFYVLRS